MFQEENIILLFLWDYKILTSMDIKKKIKSITTKIKVIKYVPMFLVLKTTFQFATNCDIYIIMFADKYIVAIEIVGV